jgi:isoquinoline 1-oxidoreductase beta subunit
MTEHDLKLTRRSFVGGSAGLTFTFVVGGLMTARPESVLASTGKAAQTIGGWVTIGTDNTITIAAPAAEMGQGVFTSLPMIVAEELDADWSKVKAEFAPHIPAVYGNPKVGNAMHAVASRTIDGYWDKVRMHGAQARRVLMQAAADKWGVPLSEVKTEPSMVVHPASGRKLSYGEIAGFATVPAELPKIEPSELKKPSEFRIIGKDVARLDVPAKVDGSAKYGIDVQVPGMVYATLIRCPVEGGEVDAVDASGVLKLPGALQTVRLKDAVALVGNSVETVFAMRNAVKVTWKGGATKDYDSVKALDEYVQRARNLGDKGLSFVSHGNVEEAFAKAAKVITGEYQTDYVYHAQMEPMNITASVSEAGDAAEIWVGTQSPTPMAGVAAGFLKTKPQNIKIHQQYLGGGFGRRIYWDLVPYVLGVAREVKRPVKMIWPREQDVKAAMNRPMTAHFMQAALDQNGNVIGWRHRIVGEATTAFMQPARLAQAKNLDPLTLEGSDHKYDIANQAIDYLMETRGTALAAWRAIGSGFNKFAIEMFMDELAHATKTDPLALRVKLLEKHPRHKAVVEAVAEMAGWGRKRPEGRALGVAYNDVWGTPAAAIAEVSVDARTGIIRVHNFWNAVNPGIVVNPAIVVAQSESNVIYGLSQALKERITFAKGEVEQSNFSDYEVLRMSEMPEIHTKVISTEDRPTGIGEIVLPLIAPAVSNAVFALTGKRLRHMPFTPERVKAALA